MKIRSIEVTAGRQFNHLTERFANFKHAITLTATLEDGDLPAYCIEKLRRDAEQIAENHKRDILHDCELSETRRGLLGRLYAARNWQADIPKMERWTVEHDADLADLASFEVWLELGDVRQRKLADRWSDTGRKDYAAIFAKATARRSENIADIERQKTEGPRNLAALEAELAALPRPRLLPEVLAAEKEIHPGHEDHPATRNDEDY